MTTRNDILNAAQAAFDEKGEVGLSLRDVASRVGVTPMAIYRHFKNKQDLLDALIGAGIAEWRLRVAAIRPCAPKRWLIKIGDAYLDFALREPRKFEAAFLTASSKALKYPDDFGAGGSPAVSLQLRLLAELANNKKSRNTATPMEMMVIMAALTQGLITLYRAGRVSGGERAFRALYRRAFAGCIESFER